MNVTINNTVYNVSSSENNNKLTFTENASVINELMDWYRKALCFEATSESWEGVKRYIPESYNSETNVFVITTY